jgi:hypothetical protein
MIKEIVNARDLRVIKEEEKNCKREGEISVMQEEILRTSSSSFDDSDNTACPVVLLEDIEKATKHFEETRPPDDKNESHSREDGAVKEEEEQASEDQDATSTKAKEIVEVKEAIKELAVVEKETIIEEPPILTEPVTSFHEELVQRINQYVETEYIEKEKCMEGLTEELRRAEELQDKESRLKHLKNKEERDKLEKAIRKEKRRQAIIKELSVAGKCEAGFAWIFRPEDYNFRCSAGGHTVPFSALGFTDDEIKEAFT